LRVPHGSGGEVAGPPLPGPRGAGGQWGKASPRLYVEHVVQRILHVDKDVVVLGWPASRRPAAVVVGPDDLVEEALASEDAVEEDLAVVHLAIVDVEVERAVGGESTICLAEARLQEGEIVVEAVGIGARAHLHRVVAVSFEADAIAGDAARGLDASVGLGAAGVEGRIDIDESGGAIWHVTTQHVEVVSEIDRVHSPRSIRGPHCSHRMPAGVGRPFRLTRGESGPYTGSISTKSAASVEG